MKQFIIVAETIRSQHHAKSKNIIVALTVIIIRAESAPDKTIDLG